MLIFQYRNKPKAYQTIKLLVQILQQKLVFLYVRNGFNLDNAYGYQLDLIGKYVGFSRIVQVVLDNKYFGYKTIEDGTTRYIGTFANLDGSGTPQPFISLENNKDNIYRLNDEDYRNLLKLVIIDNNTNCSFMDVNTKLYETFGKKIMVEDNQDMSCTYYLNGLTTVMTEVIRQNPNLLPNPMGMTIKLQIQDTFR